MNEIEKIIKELETNQYKLTTISKDETVLETNQYKLTTISKDETVLERPLKQEEEKVIELIELRITQEGVALEWLKLNEQGTYSLFNRLEADWVEVGGNSIRL